MTIRCLLCVLLFSVNSLCASEFLLTSYEDDEPVLQLSSPDSSVTLSRVAQSDDGIEPTRGHKMLKLSFSNESDHKVEVKHRWPNRPFNISQYQRMYVDVYIPEPLHTGSCGLWDSVIGFHTSLYGHDSGHWITIALDISGQSTTSMTSLDALLFENLSSSSGTIYIDNLRLVRIAPDPVENDVELLETVQRATFNYFWVFAHPHSGLTREGFMHERDTCAIGGTGMGLATIVTGVHRGFVKRQIAARRILRMLTFLEDDCSRYHGAWPHQVNGQTGETIPFSQKDNGADLAETAYLVQGMLIARQYFNQDNAVENEIRQRIGRLWQGVDWNWFRNVDGTDGTKLFWHWSPNFFFQKGHVLDGFNEVQIVYILAAASPTHPIPASLYQTSWMGDHYVNDGRCEGLRQWVGQCGEPLFWTHYSYFGFDPRYASDGYCNFYLNHRAISLSHYEYCKANPNSHVGYSDQCWGLTASFSPFGYGAWSPKNDNGTISPTAAVSAIAYTPEESMAAIRYFYNELGHSLWGEFGFRDAFNRDVEPDWYSDTWIAIDEGPIVPMIENHRSGLCWRLFMSCPDIQLGLDRLGFVNQPWDNVLTNGGFEDGGTGIFGSMATPGWVAYGQAGWLHDDAGQTLGAKAVKVWAPGSGVYQDVEVRPGDEYCVSGYMATFGNEPLVDRVGVIDVEWLNSGWGVIKVDPVSRFVAGQEAIGDWKYVEKRVVVPAGARYGRVVFKMLDDGVSPGGVVHCDCLAMVKGKRLDLNLDGVANLYDVGVLASYWLAESCGVGNGWCGGADYNRDCFVDGGDLANLVGWWLSLD